MSEQLKRRYVVQIPITLFIAVVAIITYFFYLSAVLVGDAVGFLFWPWFNHKILD